jgi:hypothetical protein
MFLNSLRSIRDYVPQGTSRSIRGLCFSVLMSMRTYDHQDMFFDYVVKCNKYGTLTSAARVLI